VLIQTGRVVFLVLFFSASPIVRAAAVYLDTLELKNIDQGWGSPHANRSVDDNRLQIGSQTFERGVGTHVDSTIMLNLAGQGLKFSGFVGIDDDTGGNRKEPVEAQITGDGKSLWKSGEIHSSAPAKKVELDLSGVKTLVLEIKSPSGSDYYGHVDWADAKFEMKGDAKPQIVAPPPLPQDEPVILTPKPGPAPRVTGARVYGQRPGRPFLFTITATGDRPMTFAADGLPVGLKLNESNGQITGKVDQPGEFKLTVRAKNDQGADEKPLRIVIGDKIALTPPMGWNSWNCWAGAVDQEKVLRSAKAMVDKGLIHHGWTYINIDDTWQGPRGGEFHAIQGNEKFPDMKGLCDQIHAMGLKAGIYSTPWMTSYAGFIGGSANNPQGTWTKPANRTDSDAGKHHGQYPFATNDARQWATWGFDYLKYDWNPNDVPHVQEMSKALIDSGRDIVYSLSNSAPFEHAADWARLANVWRTTGDITDTWRSMSSIGFAQDRWAPFAAPGHWNDPDMLVVGYVGWGPRLHPTKLSPNEQYTHISLWCLLSAPLLIGCDLDRLDDFTLNLLSNDEVLAVDQDALGQQASRVASDGTSEVWAKKLEDGSSAVGLFNRGRTPAKVRADWGSLKTSGKQSVRDLWRQKDLGTFDSQFEADVPPHGVVLVRVSPAK
jgi:alpha-galactosidase